MLRRKKKKRSLSSRLIALILLATLSLSIVTVVVGYQIYRNSRERGYIRLGQNLTRTVKNIIDGDSLDRYLSSRVTDREYETTLRIMRTIRKENSVLYLYVARMSGEKGWYFIYDADAEAPVPLGEFDPYDENYPEFKEQVMAGSVEPIISKTQWGWLLSIYEPIHNGRGELVGYVGADFSMDEIMKERRSYLLRLIIITLLITSAFVTLHILVVRKTIILPVNTMVKAAKSYLTPAYPDRPSHPSEDSTSPWTDEPAPSSISTLNIRTNDELESLAEAMKSMDRKINLTILDLKRAEEDAKAASRAKTAFLAQMSHELRTPMNAIMGMARAVLYKTDDQKRVTQAIKQILASSQRLFTILNDILDISNIESGNLILSKDIFSLADVCRSLNDLTRLQCKAKNLTFLPDTYQATGITVWGDRVRFMQAAGTILNNAVKFTGDGGEIRFIVKLKEQTETTAKICFTVSDTGIGISPEQQKKLFRAFVPVDREVSVKYGGIGAKLSVCQSIIEMMGGSIKIESKIGQGTVFSFEIVFTKATEKDQEDSSLKEFQSKNPETPAEKPANFSGKKILVVDDVVTNRMVVKIALKDTGVEIIEAQDGQQALEIASNLAEKIDLILMDVSMPNLNGYEATRAIRSIDAPWAKTIPIIALTAHTYQEDINAALEAGMDFHLGKPVNFDILHSTLVRYLPEAQVEYS